jgi:hypothetical protein
MSMVASSLPTSLVAVICIPVNEVYGVASAASVTVPEIVPEFGSRVSPAGNVPAVTVNVKRVPLVSGE